MTFMAISTGQGLGLSWESTVPDQEDFKVTFLPYLQDSNHYDTTATTATTHALTASWHVVSVVSLWFIYRSLARN